MNSDDPQTLSVQSKDNNKNMEISEVIKEQLRSQKFDISSK